MTEASDNGVKGRAPAKARALSVLCLVFLLVPNFNIIDVLPDFVAYLILARFFGRYADYAPYFAEARESFSSCSSKARRMASSARTIYSRLLDMAQYPSSS